jgi:uncharacterized cupredoxin-like copper-binding protein
MIKHLFITTISIILSISTAFADKSMMIGKKGKQEDVTRVIKVLMYDNYFEPSSFQVQSGETIKFEVENVGELVHEFNIANPKMHIQHQSEMQKMVEMEILFADSIDKDKMKKMSKMDKSMAHSHANSVLLEPKGSKDLIWKFENASNVENCLQCTRSL